MATGDTYIPILKVWAVLTGGEYDETTRNILLSIRFIRVVVAGLIGVALSVSGLQMQTVFQNPLADPYLLGVSSGAGLGEVQGQESSKSHQFSQDKAWVCAHPVL